jgi:TRAP-type mannitol/chloroaromatic compound transport system substrate-binding protein
LLQANVQLRPYSDEILTAAEKAAFSLYDEFAAKDADFKTVYQNWQQFRDRIYAWNNRNETSLERFLYAQLNKSQET